EVRTVRDDHEDIRLDRTQRVGRVFRLLRLLRLRIAQHSVAQLHGRFLHGGRAADDGDGAAAPLHLGNATRFDLADVHFDRRTRCAGTVAGLHGRDERHGGRHHTDTAYDRGGNGEKMAPGEIYAVSTHPKVS